MWRGRRLVEGRCTGTPSVHRNRYWPLFYHQSSLSVLSVVVLFSAMSAHTRTCMYHHNGVMLHIWQVILSNTQSFYPQSLFSLNFLINGYAYKLRDVTMPEQRTPPKRMTIDKEFRSKSTREVLLQAWKCLCVSILVYPKNVTVRTKDTPKRMTIHKKFCLKSTREVLPWVNISV